MFEELYPFSKVNDGILLKVRVSPKASSNKIGKVTKEPALKVYVTAVPKDGEANEAVIKLISNWLKIPKSKCCVKSGMRDKSKIIQIMGDSEDLYKLLSSSVCFGD